MKARLWKPACQDLLADPSAEHLLVETFKGAPALSFLDRTLYTDITHYLPGDLLVKADRMTMASSLEGRSPFLDHELAAWAAGLPKNLRVRGRNGKYLLRRAFSDQLPPAILARGKQGFGIPIGAWFRGPLADWARQMLTRVDSPLERNSINPILDYLSYQHNLLVWVGDKYEAIYNAQALQRLESFQAIRHL